jgi:neutral amino acid transport system ATP-binding protein
MRASSLIPEFDGVERTPGSVKRDPVLVATGVLRRFGGLTAVDVQQFQLERHSITALIGPNGAGKTTFFNLLTGFDRMDAGQVVFDGERISRKTNPSSLARAGMVRTFQLTKALSKMSVIDNMRLGPTGQVGEKLAVAPIRPAWRSAELANTERCDELLKRFQLDHMRDEFAGTLSGGQRKLLEMARALMTSPKLVMLDEPMAGVNPALKQSLLDHIVDLRSQGMTVLFVEHDMDMVREIADWVVVMAEGEIISEGTADEIGQDQAVIDAYLGSRHHQALDQALDDERANSAAAEGS